MPSHLPLPSPSPSIADSSTSTIAFLDSRLTDIAVLIAALNPAIQPYILHPAEDPILQIDTVLRSRPAVHSLYLFGHGAPGRMILGNGELNCAIAQTHAEIVSQWPVSEIRLYGCQVGQHPDLLHHLHHFTGASIAASRAILGNGNWHLDVQLGEMKEVNIIHGTYSHIFPVQRVRDINPGPNNSIASGFTIFNNALYFRALDNTNGSEVWRVDSSGNANRVTDINPGAGHSNASNLTVFNNALYFTAFDGFTGAELWRLDANGNASRVTDINPGAGSSNPSSLTVVNNALYFNAIDSNNRREIWRVNSDGSVGRVTNINVTQGAGSGPVNLTAFNNALYFTANNDGRGEELWRVDSSDITSRLTDINPGSGTSIPRELTIFNNALYFSAYSFNNGQEVWRIDSGGIISRLTDINPGAATSTIYGFTVYNNALYFSADDGTSGQELWRIDSNDIVSRVADINPGRNGSNPLGMTVYNNALYFEAFEATSGHELWRVGPDGIASGVADITPGAGHSIPSRFIVYNNALYFRANDGTNGQELWRVGSNGTVSRVTDINPGAGQASINNLIVFNNALYFTATDGVSGDELYRWVDSTPANDFTKDGNSDLLWRNQWTGAIAIWSMNGTNITSYSEIGTVAPSSGWAIVGTGDFSKDGNTDLLWRNTFTGQNAIWSMDGTTLTGYTELLSVAANSGWDVVGVGDLSNDGNTDLLWHNAWSGTVAIWSMDGTTLTGYTEVTSVPAASGWGVAGMGDFTGDSLNDIVWRNEWTGQNAIWTMNGTTVTGYTEIASVPGSSGWRIAGVGDYTQDGKADLLWQNDWTGQTLAWSMNGTSITGIIDLPSMSPTTGWSLA